MKKTIVLAALLATSIGSAALAAEATPATTPAMPAPSATMPAQPAAPLSTVVVIEHALPGAHLGSKIIGADVYSTAGEKVGDVNDLILDGTGKITGVVVGVGGFLGVGEKNVALAWDAVTVGPDEKGKPRLTARVTKDTLDKAAPFVATHKS